MKFQQGPDEPVIGNEMRIDQVGFNLCGYLSYFAKRKWISQEIGKGFGPKEELFRFGLEPFIQGD